MLEKIEKNVVSWTGDDSKTKVSSPPKYVKHVPSFKPQVRSNANNISKQCEILTFHLGMNAKKTLDICSDFDFKFAGFRALFDYIYI